MTTIPDLVRTAYENWNNAAVLADVGRELEERTRFEVARVFLKRAIELAPADHPFAYINLAFTHFRDNVSHEDVGLNILAGGIEATNSDLVRTIYASYLPEERDEEARELLNTAAQNLRGVHIATVASIAVWRIGPERALEMLGDIHVHLKQLLAGADVDSLSDLVTLCVRLHMQKLFDIETIDLAHACSVIASLQPERIRSHNGPTSVYHTLKRWPELEQAALNALRHLPDDESMLMFVAIAAEGAGDILKAEQWYQRAIGAKLSFAGARIRLARMWDANGQAERAIDMVREMIAANPDYAFGYVQASTMLNKHGHTDEALRLMKHAKPNLSPWMIESIGRNESVKQLYDLAG